MNGFLPAYLRSFREKRDLVGRVKIKRCRIRFLLRPIFNLSDCRRTEQNPSPYRFSNKFVKPAGDCCGHTHTFYLWGIYLYLISSNSLLSLLGAVVGTPTLFICGASIFLPHFQQLFIKPTGCRVGVADGDGQSVGHIVGLGGFLEAENSLSHLDNLLLHRPAVAYHRLLHL